MAAPSGKARAERDAKALELRRAGVPVPRIVEQLGFSSRSACEAAIERAIDAQGILTDPSKVRELELDRLDRLQQAVWVKAVKGDVAAIDRVKALAELRMRIAGVASRGESVMTAAFDDAVEALDTEASDGALVAAGRRIAERIDSAASAGDAQSETKALYLVPHLMNVLRELGATPAARAELEAKAKANNGDNQKRAKLTALRSGRSA